MADSSWTAVGAGGMLTGVNAATWTLIGLLGTSTFAAIGVLAAALFSQISRVDGLGDKLDRVRDELLGGIDTTRVELRDELTTRMDAGHADLGRRIDALEHRIAEHLAHHAA